MRLLVEGVAASVQERELFSGVRFELEPGQTRLIAGPSGVGKTMLLRLLSGLVPLRAGNVSLDGRTPEEWGFAAWRTELLYVPQRPPTFEGTAAQILERIVKLRHQRRRPAADARELAAAWGIKAGLWSNSWRSLSGGEQQRILLAIAVTRKPTVLLLDEPTSAIDDELTRRIEADLASQTKIWVTHDRAQKERVGGSTLEIGA